MKRFYGMIIILLCLQAGGQGLKPGDRVPDLVLRNVLQVPGESLRLSDLRGRLVILDFWGTGCKLCLEAFPLMDSLQRQFGRQIQIVLVNEQSRDSTLRFFKRMRRVHRPSLPMVTGDSVLQALFPHNFVPWHVWIDGEGVVQYITEGHNANTEFITQFLQKGRVDMRQLVYRDLKGRTSNTMLDGAGGGREEERPEYYSYIARCVPEARIGNSKGLKSGAYQVRYTNNCQSVRDLYAYAYEEGGRYDFRARNTVVLEVADSFAYVPPRRATDWDRWLERYCFTYDLRLPASRKEEHYRIMQQDLERYFGLEARVEQRPVRCLALVRTGRRDKLSSRGGARPERHRGIPLEELNYFHGAEFSEVAANLAAIFTLHGYPLPLVDRTGYRGRVDIGISQDALVPFNPEAIKRELQLYGLDLVEQECVLDVLVLKERPGSFPHVK